MSPLSIKRFVAIILVLSPWIFIPGVIKDGIFIVLGILLFISTLDLRRKQPLHRDDLESKPLSVSPEP